MQDSLHIHLPKGRHLEDLEFLSRYKISPPIIPSQKSRGQNQATIQKARLGGGRRADGQP